MTLAEVEAFLNDFKVKMQIFDIVFRDERNKNAQTLLDLGITPKQRRAIIENIEALDCIGEPIDDKLYGIASLWTFGKMYGDTELYIKISKGSFNNPTICISFHTAEFPLQYLFK